MKKIYRKLTQEQKNKGVVFSSTLTYEDKNEDREDLTTHEVTRDMTPEEQSRKIKLLRDDSFFNSSPYKYNVIRS